jgi:hypothetical protein
LVLVVLVSRRFANPLRARYPTLFEGIPSPTAIISHVDISSFAPGLEVVSTSLANPSSITHVFGQPNGLPGLFGLGFDPDFHALKGGTAEQAQQYQFLINELKLVMERRK